MLTFRLEWVEAMRRPFESAGGESQVVGQSRRDALLMGVAEAAKRLLSIADFDAAVHGALEAIATAAGIDRIYILENQIDPSSGEVVAHCPFERTVPGIVKSSDTPGRYPMSYTKFGDWPHQFRAGQAVQAIARDLSDLAQDLQEQDEALSLLAVPIMVEGDWWGVIGFDDCTTERVWSEAEISVLETAAASFAGALERRANLAELERRDALLDGVAEASQQLLVMADFDASVNGALEAIATASRIDRIYIDRYHVDGETGRETMTCPYEWTVPGVVKCSEILGRFPMDLEPFGSLIDLLKAGRPMQVLAQELSQPARELQELDEALSLLAVPILIDGQLWGCVGFDDCTTERVWSEAEIAVLETAAACIGSAIERDRTRKEREAAAQARAEELSQVNSVLKDSLRRLASEPDLDVFLGHVIDSINQAVGAAKGHVFIYDAEVNTLKLQLSVQQGMIHLGATDDEPRLFHSAFPADITPAYPEMCKTNEVVLLSLVQETSDIWPGTAEWHHCCGHQEAAVVMLRSGDRPIGMLGLCFTETVTITEEAKALINALADQAAVAIDLARLAEENKKTAVVREREAAAQARAAELAKANEAISKTLNTLAAKPQLSEFLGQLLLAIAQQVNSRKVHLFLYDEATHCLNLHTNIEDGQVFAGPSPNDHDFFHHPIPADITPAWQLISEAEDIVISDLSSPLPDEIWWPGTQAWHQAQGHISMACIPMKAGDQALGFIGFAFRDRTVLSNEQLEFMQALTNQAIVAIQLTRLAEEAQQTAILQEQERAAQERAAQLTRSNQALKSSLDSLAQQPELDAFLQRVVNEAAVQTGATNGHLFLYDFAAQTYFMHVATDNNGNWREVKDMELWQQPIPVDEAPAFWEMMQEKKPFYIQDLQANLKPGPHIWQPSIDWHLQRGHKSFICAPLVLGDRVLGFLGLPFVGTTSITPEDVELAQALTNQATLAIQLTRLADEAKQTAILQEQQKATQERAAELAQTNEAIAQSLTTLAANPELDPFLATLVSEMARQLNAGKVHLFLYDQPSHTLSQRVVVQDGQVYLGAGPNDPEILRHPIPADITTGWDAILNAEKPLTYDEAHPFDETIWWPDTIEWHKAQGHKAVTCIPLKAGETPIGYIGFCFYDRTFLSDEQLEFMQALANQAIVAIQLTRLADEAKQTAVLQEQEKAAQDRATELAKTNEAIAQTLEALTTDPELDRFLGQILTCIIEQIGADDTHLFLYDSETHTLRSHLAVQNNTVYTGTAPNDPAIFSTDVPADITAVWQIVINSPKPLILNDQNSKNGALFWPTTQAWHESRGHQSATCVCMKIGDEPIGFIGFAFCEKAVLTDEQLEFIQALTNQATLAIHLTRLAEQARTNALTDERTRLAREIHDTLAQAFTGVSLQLEAVRGLLKNPAALQRRSGGEPNEQGELSIDDNLDLSIAEAHILRARDLARAGLSEARRSVRALRSEALETDALPDALRKALTQTQRDTHLTTQFYLEGQPIPLPDEIQLNLLRIAQEAITNALRHADATQLDLTLSFAPESNDPKVQLRIVDNGRGFDTSTLLDSSGFGIIGIRERTARFYGSFDLQSTPNIGTTLEINIPLREPLR